MRVYCVAVDGCGGALFKLLARSQDGSFSVRRAPLLCLSALRHPGSHVKNYLSRSCSKEKACSSCASDSLAWSRARARQALATNLGTYGAGEVLLPAYTRRAASSTAQQARTKRWRAPGQHRTCHSAFRWGPPRSRPRGRLARSKAEDVDRARPPGRSTPLRSHNTG